MLESEIDMRIVNSVWLIWGFIMFGVGWFSSKDWYKTFGFKKSKTKGE